MALKENKCDICNKIYVSYKTLWEHRKKFHKNDSTNIINDVNAVNTIVNAVLNAVNTNVILIIVPYKA